MIFENACPFVSVPPTPRRTRQVDQLEEEKSKLIEQVSQLTSEATDLRAQLAERQESVSDNIAAAQTAACATSKLKFNRSFDRLNELLACELKVTF